MSAPSAARSGSPVFDDDVTHLRRITATPRARTLLFQRGVAIRRRRAGAGGRGRAARPAGGTARSAGHDRVAGRASDLAAFDDEGDELFEAAHLDQPPGGV
jgi:hypothetical protein